MTTRILPNPASPYATANPSVRHLIPSFLGLAPTAGGLALTACERMAVVPTEPLGDATDLLAAGHTDELPPGLCADCIGAATGEPPEDDAAGIAPMECQHCGGQSSQGVWCALCRQERHDAWWPTREAEAQ